MKQIASWLFCCLLVCLTGCGYTLVGQGSLPKHIKTIAIPVFANTTLEKGVEDVITQALIEKFVKGGKARLVAENEADAILTGTIRGYKADEALTYNAKNEIASYKMVVTINAELRDMVKNATLWKIENLAEDGEFAGGPEVNPSETQANKEEALKKLAVELAERVQSLALEGF